MVKPRPDLKSQIAKTALRLAASQPFSTLTLAHIAKAAKLPPEKVHEAYAAPRAILTYLVEDNSRQSLAVLTRASPNESLHDRLFEAMMARIDRLQADRIAYLGLLKESRQRPDWAAALAQPLFSGMQAVVKTISPDQPAIKQNLAAAGLLAIYFSILCVWQRDDTPDLAKTMASLDRHLRRSSKLAEMIFRVM